MSDPRAVIQNNQWRSRLCLLIAQCLQKRYQRTALIPFAVNIGSGNDLLPDGTKALPELMLTNHLMCTLFSSLRGYIASHTIWATVCTIHLIKSPRYTRGDFIICIGSFGGTGSAACASATTTADFCPRDSFRTFRISSILAGLMTLITWLDSNRFSSWPWSWIFKVKYGICYAKNPIATKRKVNVSIEHWASNVAISFDLGLDLDLELSISKFEIAGMAGLIDVKRKGSKSVGCWVNNMTLTIRMALTMDFQGQILK